MRYGTIDHKWQALESGEQVNSIVEESYDKPVIIFKLSSRCGVSAAVFEHFQEKLRKKDQVNEGFYLLDVISNKTVSDLVAAVLRYLMNRRRRLSLKTAHAIIRKVTGGFRLKKPFCLSIRNCRHKQFKLSKLFLR